MKAKKRKSRKAFCSYILAIGKVIGEVKPLTKKDRDNIFNIIQEGKTSKKCPINIVILKNRKGG